MALIRIDKCGCATGCNDFGQGVVSCFIQELVKSWVIVSSKPHEVKTELGGRRRLRDSLSYWTDLQGSGLTGMALSGMLKVPLLARLDVVAAALSSLGCNEIYASVLEGIERDRYEYSS